MTENNLRARRRQQTRAEIHQAAVDLVLARGFAEVTVEDIAQQAGISPRTFFNYFPTKQEAIFPGPPLLDPEAVNAFVNGRASLVDDLRELVTNYAELAPKVRKQMKQLRPILAEQPDVWIHMHKRFGEVEDAFAQAIGRRRAHPEPTGEDRALAAIATAIMRSSLRCWAVHDEGVTDVSLKQVVTKNFAALQLLASAD